MPPTTQLLIRAAKSKDLPDLLQLTLELGYDADHTELADRFEQIREKEDHLILVADLDRTIIGWLHLFLAYRLESNVFAEIGGLVVAPQWRRNGIAGKLLDTGKIWAQSKHVEQIRVRVNFTRKEAFVFYRCQGFRKAKDQTAFDLQI